MNTATTASNTIKPDTPPSRAMFVAAIAIAVACGGLVAVQSRINGQLGHELDDGFIAAIISFGGGLVLLSFAVPFSRRTRTGIANVWRALREHTIPWWYVCGGFAGALFVLGQGLTIGILGVALFTIAVVAGQTVSGLLIDRLGMGTTPPRVVSGTRFLGAAISLVAVGIAVSPEFAGTAPLWMLIMPFIVGFVLSWQMSVNGQVKQVARSAVSATYVNMLGGTALLIIVAIIDVSISGPPAQFPTDPWLYSGGAIAIIFITGFAAVIRVTGVLVQGLAVIAGQLLMSLVLDLVAPTGHAELAWTTVVGTGLTLVAVVVASINRRSKRRPNQRPNQRPSRRPNQRPSRPASSTTN